MSSNSQTLQEISDGLRETRRQEKATAVASEPAAPPVKAGRGKAAATPPTPAPVVPPVESGGGK